VRSFRIIVWSIEGLAALAVAACASDPNTRACLGTAASEHDKIAACTRAIESAKPDSGSLAEVYTRRADLLAWLGQYDPAITDYGEAIKLKPGSADAYGWRGSAFSRKGERDLAIADFTEAIRRDPHNAWWYIFRGARWVEKRDYGRAIADFSEGIRVAPDKNRPFFYLDRGIAWRSKGDHDRAIADFGEAIRLIPKFPDPYYQRGIAWGSKGDYDRAIADYGEAIRLDADDPDPYRGRASAYRAQGKSDLAAADLREAGRLSVLSARGATSLDVSFRRLYYAVEHREPLDILRSYFSEDFLGRLGTAFGYEWLDQSLGWLPEFRQRFERIEGARGCVAYAQPHKAQASGEWIELRQFSYSQVEGRWLISDAALSISAHHKAVEAGPYCLTLGWPWK
jgi:Flp pilus assembly protein TadD